MVMRGARRIRTNKTADRRRIHQLVLFMSDYRCPECHANLPWPTSHRENCTLAGLKYSDALTVDFVKMLLETVKSGGKVVTFNDGDIYMMERILKENDRDLATEPAPTAPENHK